jgi:hypothetical protein
MAKSMTRVGSPKSSSSGSARSSHATRLNWRALRSLRDYAEAISIDSAGLVWTWHEGACGLIPLTPKEERLLAFRLIWMLSQFLRANREYTPNLYLQMMKGMPRSARSRLAGVKRSSGPHCQASGSTTETYDAAYWYDAYVYWYDAYVYYRNLAASK